MSSYAPVSPMLSPSAKQMQMFEDSPLLKTPDDRKLRLNTSSIVGTLLLPWAIFSVMLWALSFDLRRNRPGLCFGLVALCLLVVLGCASTLKSRATTQPKAPSWLGIFTITSAIAWISAVLLGLNNYAINVKPAYDLQELGTYFDVDPSHLQGQQLMDAGVVNFAPSAWIDVSKSMGFKKGGMYCVAPISIGDATTKLDSYDFWAVGTNCCDGNQATFSCLKMTQQSEHGAIRLFDDQKRAVYRLAVQQAEATYNIKASHPIFFSWIGDAVTEERTWREAGHHLFLVAIGTAFIIQAFIVTAATLSFAKVARP